MIPRGLDYPPAPSKKRFLPIGRITDNPTRSRGEFRVGLRSRFGLQRAIPGSGRLKKTGTD